MTSKIAFLVEGSLEMGMGHIYKSITLAEELQDKGEICFLTRSAQIAVNQIENSGFRALKLKNDDEVARCLEEIKPDVVIIDRLEVEEFFAKKLKNDLNTRLVIFDNLSAANKHADVVINAGVGSNFENKRFIDKNTNTLYYYGPKYLVLRKEFYEFKAKGKRLNDKIRRILLIFGGSDPSNLTSKVLDELLTWHKELKTDVILGSGFVYSDELNRVLKKHQSQKGNAKVYQNIKNVAELMHKADLVIASPGLSMFEAFCVGTPVIAISQTQFHKNLFDKFFPTLHEDEIGKLKDIISAGDFLKPDTEYIKNLDMGEGKAEIVKEIRGCLEM